MFFERSTSEEERTRLVDKKQEVINQLNAARLEYEQLLAENERVRAETFIALQSHSEKTKELAEERNTLSKEITQIRKNIAEDVAFNKSLKINIDTLKYEIISLNDNINSLQRSARDADTETKKATDSLNEKRNELKVLDEEIVVSKEMLDDVYLDTKEAVEEGNKVDENLRSSQTRLNAIRDLEIKLQVREQAVAEREAFVKHTYKELGVNWGPTK